MTPTAKRILWASGLSFLVCVLFALLPGHWKPDQTPVRVRVHHHVPITTTTQSSTTIPAVVVTHSVSPPNVVSRSRPAPQVRSDGDIWAALANCESHGNPQAVGGGGRYFGAFQFSLSTWHSMGLSGNPVDYPYEVQRDAAIRLVARSGWGQFPVCGRRVAH